MTASNMTNVVLSQTTIGGNGSDLGFTNPVTVTISTTGDEENLTKTIIYITPPKTDTEKDTTVIDYGPNKTISIDILNKVERRITIDGELVNDVVVDYTEDTNTLAEGKKSDLKKLFLGGGVMNMLYEGSVFTISIDKLSIKRERFDGLTGDEGITEFSVKFSAIRSEDF
jgi:hypothetical protein